MDPNPLNWSALPFITLYLAIAGGILGVLIPRRAAIGPREDRDPGGSLGLLDLAVLAIGLPHACDTILLGLLRNGSAKISDTLIMFRNGAWMPPEVGSFAVKGGITLTRPDFQATMRPHLTPIESRLRQRGLLTAAADAEPFNLKVMLAFLVPVGLAIAKIDAELDRPVQAAILAALVAATIGAGIVLIASRPRLSVAGHAALEEAFQHFSRPVLAPVGDEIMLAFVLAGPVVLAGTEFETLYRMLVTPAAGTGGPASAGDPVRDGTGTAAAGGTDEDTGGGGPNDGGHTGSDRARTV
jgi:uncharacterized protein (TIGR04222 family)